jgi:hypothetical protein
LNAQPVIVRRVTMDEGVQTDSDVDAGRVDPKQDRRESVGSVDGKRYFARRAAMGYWGLLSRAVLQREVDTEAWQARESWRRVMRLLIRFAVCVLLDLLYVFHLACVLECGKKMRDHNGATADVVAEKCRCLTWTYPVPLFVSTVNGVIYGLLNRHVRASGLKLLAWAWGGHPSFSKH